MENQIYSGIFGFIIKNSIRDEDNIKFKQIYNSVIPKSIKNYFFIKTEQLLASENFIRFGGNRFDFTSMEVRKQILRLENLMKENCIFQRKEFENELENAINLQLNYLKSPIKTLVEFIYNDNSSKNFSQIMQSFKYFTDYMYYGEIIESYFEQKEIEIISRDECKSILRKIDNAIIKRLTSEEIAWLPKPLSDFINVEIPEKKINTDLLISFYEDKELFGLASALKLEFNIRGKNAFTFDEINNVITQIDDIKKPLDKSPENITADNINKDNVKVEKSIVENTIIENVSNEKNTLTGKQDSELNILQDSRKIKRKIIDLSEEEEFKDTKNNKIKDAKENFDIDDTTYIFIPKETRINITDIKRNNNELEKKDLNFIMNNNDVKIVEAKKYLFDISEKEKKIFIKKLFDKDQDLYEKTLDEICRCESWSGAAFFIDKLFLENDINPFSNHAVDFTNKIQTAFLTKE